MQIRPVLRSLGMLLVGEAVAMLPALAVALYYQEGDAWAFLLTIGILLVVGLPLAVFIRSKVRNLYAREGMAIVGLGWALLSVFGALPYLFSGVMDGFADALFESVSGFTTTGASVLEAVEGVPRGLLFWRSFSHWVGGMGVLVLTIALLPQLGIRNMEVLKAESSGPNPGKIVPRLQDSAKYLYIIYIGLSLVLFLLLGLTGMPLYDSLVNTFATAGTGGFAVRNQSIGSYGNPAAEIIIAIFMFLFSINFALYFALLMGQVRKFFANRELLFFLGMVVISIALIALNIRHLYDGFGTALRHAAFQVTSLVSTTGYSTADDSTWPMFSQVLLMMLMLVGGCAGSTAGGFKVVRLILAGKALRRELHIVLHPRIVRTVTMEGKPVTESMLRAVLVFFFGYISIIGATSLIVAMDGYDGITTLTSVLAMISNAGPGLSLVGPTGNYSIFSDVSKIAMSFCMLFGRLEILPVLTLFMPSMWRSL